jgi:hypothetical protein
MSEHRLPAEERPFFPMVRGTRIGDVLLSSLDTRNDVGNSIFCSLNRETGVQFCESARYVGFEESGVMLNRGIFSTLILLSVLWLISMFLKSLSFFFRNKTGKTNY